MDKNATESRSESPKNHRHPSGSLIPKKKIIDSWISFGTFGLFFHSVGNNKIPFDFHIFQRVWGFFLGVDLFCRAAYHTSSPSRSSRAYHMRGLYAHPLVPHPGRTRCRTWNGRDDSSFLLAKRHPTETRCIFEAFGQGTMSFCLSKAPAVVFRRPWWKIYMKPKCTMYGPCTLWWTNSLQLKIAIEIVDFPIKNGGSFHCYVSSPEGNIKNDASMSGHRASTPGKCLLQWSR